tara:strand:- start:261 stop:431 length:171 start_codon:yes stop_codon:yes gene_type:complete
MQKNESGINLFPEFLNLFSIIEEEVKNLSSIELDFTSQKWAWAEWSIETKLAIWHH